MHSRLAGAAGCWRRVLRRHQLRAAPLEQLRKACARSEHARLRAPQPAIVLRCDALGVLHHREGELARGVAGRGGECDHHRRVRGAVVVLEIAYQLRESWRCGARLRNL